jgi:phasin family protein
MHFSPAPVAPATVKYAETQLKLFADLTAKVMTGVEQLVELNLRATRVLLAESNLTARQFISVRQPQELFALWSAQAQPTAQRALQYASHVARITTTTQAEWALVSENRIGEVSRSTGKLISDLLVAPVAPGMVVSLMTDALDSARADMHRRGSDRAAAVARDDIIDLEEDQIASVAQQLGYEPAARNSRGIMPD